MDHHENGKNAAMNIYPLGHVDTYVVVVYWIECNSNRFFMRPASFMYVILIKNDGNTPQ